MKQYFGGVVSLPTHSNYWPLSHESSPNDRIQGSGDEYVLCARPGAQCILLYIFRLCICERERKQLHKPSVSFAVIYANMVTELCFTTYVF